MPSTSPVRITPAYAGKRKPPAFGATNRRDHPRVCGEKSTAPTKMETCLGSPPRMRGKAPLDDTEFAYCGITPAYAGKSSAFPLLTATERDHPRVCGEKWALQDEQSWPYGSPPRMRGKGPARPSLNGPRRDHPRVCGEKLVVFKTLHPHLGSPPRMRGKVPGTIFHAMRAGITPAYAGKSSSWER